MERGGPLNKVPEVLGSDPRKLGLLEQDYHVYLENLSGDYFSYDGNTNSWKPKGNFGLHYSRITASLQGAVVKGPTDMLKKVKTYQPKVDNKGAKIIVTGCNQSIVTIKAT